jgi:hypothetical protein
MTIHLRPLLATVASAVLIGTPALSTAESIASSAASSASITASSASESLGASSNSSKSGNTAQAGDYRIEAVADAAQPGKVRLTLQPLEPTAERTGFVLTLPQAALDQQGLGRGATVRVRERAYGFEFARADNQQAFFLVLADRWQRELDPRRVTAAPPSL